MTGFFLLVSAVSNHAAIMWHSLMGKCSSEALILTIALLINSQLVQDELDDLMFSHSFRL